MFRPPAYQAGFNFNRDWMRHAPTSMMQAIATGQYAMHTRQVTDLYPR